MVAVNAHGKPAAKVLFGIIGSRGDVYPSLAIARAVQARGVRVAFATQERFRAAVESFGLEYHLLRPEPEPDGPETREERKQRTRSSASAVRDVLYARSEETYRDLLAAGSDADLLVHGFFLPAAHMAAQRLGIPFAPMFYSPGQMNSVYDPPVLPPLAWLHPWQQRSPRFARAVKGFATWAIRSWSKPYHQLRKREGMAPEPGDPILQPATSPWLTLALFSACVGRPQPDWPASTVITGFPALEEDPSPETAALEQFLASGSAPIVASLGSSTSVYRERFFTDTIEAARILDRRLVLIAGPEANGLRSRLDPARVYVSAYVPYSFAFRHAACVVIAGTVGAISFAMRAGRPMLIVASEHAADQPDAGVRCQRMGSALWMHLRDYRPGPAVEHLRTLLEKPSFAEQARQCAAMIALETGAQAAADAILKVLRTLLERSPQT